MSEKFVHTTDQLIKILGELAVLEHSRKLRSAIAGEACIKGKQHETITNINYLAFAYAKAYIEVSKEGCDLDEVHEPPIH